MLGEKCLIIIIRIIHKTWRIKNKDKIKRTYNTFHSEKLLFTFHCYLTIPLFNATIHSYKQYGGKC